jgi:hypothetical protein
VHARQQLFQERIAHGHLVVLMGGVNHQAAGVFQGKDKMHVQAILQD